MLFKACFLPGFTIMIISLSVMAFYSIEITRILFDTDQVEVFLLLSASICIAFISRFLSLILRMQERGLAYSMSEISPRVIQLCAMGGVFWLDLHRNLLTLLYILIISSLVVFLLYAYNTRLSWRSALTARSSYELNKSLLKYGMPLVLTGFVYWGLTATSSFMLRRESTLAELGIYSVTSSIAAVAAIFQSIFSVIWAPIFYKWLNDGLEVERLDRVAQQALTVVCIIFCAVGSLSWITDYLLPEHYSGVKYLLVCAVAPTLLYALSEITSVGIGISRRTGLTIWSALAALTANIFICYLLIPSYGAAGAVIANAISYMVFFIVRTEISARVWQSLSRKKIYLTSTTFVVFAIGTVLVGPNLSFNFSLLWLMLLPFIFLIFLCEIKSFAYLKLNK
jgi:O-antigen/teichoic acid export membrane protein